jgi:hypothetical protein
MDRVEQYIKDYTKKCSNKISDLSCKLFGHETKYMPWLTVEHAQRIGEIAREDTIKEVVNWLEEKQLGSILTMADVIELVKTLKNKK